MQISIDQDRTTAGHQYVYHPALVNTTSVSQSLTSSDQHTNTGTEILFVGAGVWSLFQIYCCVVTMSAGVISTD